MDTDVVYCDCRDLAAIGRVSGSGSASLVVWLGWILTSSTMTAGILLPLDVSVAVGRLVT